MREGLLWFDDSGRPVDEKIGAAAKRYRRKYGGDANACYVHPSALDGGEPVDAGGVRVMPLPSVLRHHFWIGREETVS